ncbi:hypothetical protein CGCS363_v014495 [Colletotrichum siamense]|uniref:uncharacterized protein n=1 Tax=Colletotrichum siamense TaxID=690259 RepID=UPI001872500A|nr:uncharacterized protein CGCS363_v014495 [Colletotrichum siamense]KAF5485170.1 hypothetical protein CGCS363_v014495 [Colletotrichum siamense]
MMPTALDVLTTRHLSSARLTPRPQLASDVALLTPLAGLSKFLEEGPISFVKSAFGDYCTTLTRKGDGFAMLGINFYERRY